MKTITDTIGVIGDMHLKEVLSYGEYIGDRREQEKQAILTQIIEELSDCRYIVFMGDQLNAKNNPSEVLREFVKFIEAFGEREIYLLAGNHEKWGDGKSAIDFLKEVKKSNWHIITDQCTQYTLGSLKASFCPYFSKVELDSKDDQEATNKLMSMLKKQAESELLFTHHAISDTLTNTDISTNLFREIVLPKTELEQSFKLVIGGHIHRPQQHKKTIVAGSIFNNEIGEDGKKIWKISLPSLAVQSIQLFGRKIVKIENDFSAIWDLPRNSIVKIILTDPALKDKIPDIKEAASKHLGQDGAWLLVEHFPNQRTKIIATEDLTDVSLEKMIEIYAKHKKIDTAQLQLGLELIKEYAKQK